MVARAGSLCPACHPRAHIDTLDENAKRRITLFCSCFTFLVRHDFSNCDTEERQWLRRNMTTGSRRMTTVDCVELWAAMQ
jgi:hypothetical protein